MTSAAPLLADLDGPSFGFVDMLRFARDPLQWWIRCAERFPDPCRMTMPRQQPALVSWHPDGVREIFLAPPDRLGVFGADLAEPAVGKHSLLVLEGERHKRERKLLAPPFHGERMAAYGSIVVEATRRRIALAPPGRLVDARGLTEAISLEVILRAVFGVREEARLPEVGHVVASAIGAVTPLLLFVKPARVDLGALSPGGRLARAQAACDRALLQILDERRRDEAAHEDILSLVLRLVDEEGRPLSDRELMDELKTMLFAGHETTATAMAWALFELLRRPELLRRVEDEIASLGADPPPQAYAALPLLSAVCQETLRVRPVVVDVMRTVKAPITVRGVEVPAGGSVCAPVALLHRDPDLYPEPDRFRPERFLERRFSPFEFAPFGGGVRRCLGADFALFEMKIALAVLLSEARWRLADETERGMRLRNITVGPKRPIEVLRA